MGFFYIVGSCGAEAWDYDGLSVELLEMLGRGYVIEHCVSLFNKKAKEKAYRIYVTDTLKLLNENIAKRMCGKTLEYRYYDLVEGKKETKNAGEIVLDVMRRAGLRIEGA